MPAPTYATEIARLEQLINSATSDVSADGVRTAFDLEAARTRLNELRRLATPNDTTRVRRKHAGLDLGGCW